MKRGTYGTMADFATEETFLLALASIRRAGLRNVETFTPYGVDAEESVAPRRKSPVGPIMLSAGIVGGLSAFFMQWYAARDYWLNIGGRPVNSWPSFIPVTFEMTVLSAALAGAAAMFWLAGLPRLDHPVFSDPRFRRASQDRFFICIRADGPGYTPERAKNALVGADAESVDEVLE